MKEYFLNSILDFGQHQGQILIDVFKEDYHNIEWYLEVIPFFTISIETLSQLQEINSQFQFSDKALQKIRSVALIEPADKENDDNALIILSSNETNLLVNMQDEIELKIKEDKERALDETMWGKPANDIITGIQSIDNVNPARALWEMVQNARDVSINEGAVIVFERRESSFIFRHNGLPFENKSIAALNLQTSSKVRNDIKQIGQYGTGFLTTHKFGLKFLLSGALKVYENGDDVRFFNFDKFLVDRSPNDMFQMISNLKNQQRLIDGMGCRIEVLSNNPNPSTEFYYKHECDVELTRVKTAMEISPSLTPYVLAINDRINKISFIDSVSNQCTSFQRDFTHTIESNENYSLICVDILNQKDEKAEIIKVFLLESNNDKIEECNSSKVTVILPINDYDGKYKVFTFSKTIPSLFLYLPLIGTEKWGINYIIHSPLFICDNDSRDSLRFVGNGQNNDDQAVLNKELINLSYELVTSFINNNLYKLIDSRLLATVSFATNDINSDLAEYYQLQQNKWVKYFETQKLVLVKDGCYKMPCEISLLGRDLYLESIGNTDFLDAIYSILSFDDSFVIPKKENILFWSNTIYDWYGEELANKFISIKDIAQIIQRVGVSILGVDNILCFDQFLIKNRTLDIFDKYAIIPTEKNILKIKSELQKPDNFSSEIRCIMEELLPADTSTFVHPLFDCILLYPEYTINSLKDAMSNKINQMQTDQARENNDLRKSYLSNSKVDIDKVQNALFNDSQIKALMKFFNMQIKDSSDSFASKIYNQLKLYYKFDEQINPKLDSSIFDYKQVCRTLLYNALLDFTLRTFDVDNLDRTWVLDTVKIIFESKDFSNALLYYKVYPNQENSFRYSEQIKKENDLPERLKDLYDIFVVENNMDDLDKKSIRNILLCPDYNNYFISSGQLQGYDLSSKIFERIKIDSNSYPDISDYKLKDYVLEIIQNFDEENGTDLWCKLFPNIEKDKPLIMMSVINDKQRKSSLFKIMRYDDLKFDKISKLAEDPDFDLIIQYGKEQLQSKRNEEADFQYKKSLGEYVEAFLQKELQDKLNIENLEVENCQGGQDLIIKYKDNPIYYLEIKSRWRNTQSVLMSALQLKRSVQQKDNYALCVVDMTNCQVERIYPFLEENIDRIQVLDNIGIYNETLFTMVDNENDETVHLGGNYQVVVPQNFIVSRSVSFEVLLNNIINSLQY